MAMKRTLNSVLQIAAVPWGLNLLGSASSAALFNAAYRRSGRPLEPALPMRESPLQIRSFEAGDAAAVWELHNDALEDAGDDLHQR